MPSTPPEPSEIARNVTLARERIRIRPPDTLIIRPGAGQESVWDYPRPPRVEPVRELVTISLNATLIVATREALRVVETSGAPAIYVSMRDLLTGELRGTSEWSLCEWKGVGYYYDLAVAGCIVRRVGWAFPQPFTDLRQGYERLKHRIAFYPSRLICKIAGERARAQPGSYYGGWVTSRVVGPFKGEAGSQEW